MRADDEVQRAWDEHVDAPEAVAARLPDLIDRAMPADSGKLALLIIHLMGERLGRFDEGLALMERLVEHGRTSTDGVSADAEAVDRALAVFRICVGDQAGFEALLGPLGSRRSAQEALVLALAAAAAGSHGRPDAATTWLTKASQLSYGLADGDPAVRALAVASCTLADRLLGRTDRTEAEKQLLRTTAISARTCWDRAGTWVELQRAELRQSAAHLALGEPIGAVAHAEAALAVCVGNGATADFLVFAYEGVALARIAAGDPKGAATARDRLIEQMAAVEPDVRPRAEAAAAALAALL